MAQPPRWCSRFLISTLSAAMLATSAPAQSTSGRVKVRVALRTSHFLDGTEPATFEMRGPCVRESDVVDLAASVSPCGRRGTLQTARLGFDVRRSAEAVPADAPGIETPQGAAKEQLTTVYVGLRSWGNLSVAVRGRRTSGVDPHPVAGSPSEGGRIEGRSVSWHIPKAEPGSYAFSARFDTGASAGFTGTFLPEVRVERRAPTRRLLDHFQGSLPAVSGEIHRTSLLTLRQRVAPATGPPAIVFDPPSSAARRGPPIAWGTSVGFRAEGIYQARPSANVSRERVYKLARIAPGSVGHVNTASTGFSFSYGGLAGVKMVPDAYFEFARTGKGNHLNQAKVKIDSGPVTYQDLMWPSNGTLYDGDSGSFGIGLALGSAHTERKGEPTDPAGVLDHDWDGGTAPFWTVQHEYQAPGVKPDGVPLLPTTRASYGFAASIPVIARGGDIDNRGGRKPIEGRRIAMKVPRGSSFVVFLIVSAPPESKYEPELSIERDRVTIVPRIMPGGFVLRSTGSGYRRDWAISNQAQVFVFDPERGDRYEAQVLSAVPEDAKSSIILAGSEGRRRHFGLGPGSWRIRAGVTAGSVSRVAISPGNQPAGIVRR